MFEAEDSMSLASSPPRFSGKAEQARVCIDDKAKEVATSHQHPEVTEEDYLDAARAVPKKWRPVTSIPR